MLLNVQLVACCNDQLRRYVAPRLLSEPLDALSGPWNREQASNLVSRSDVPPLSKLREAHIGRLVRDDVALSTGKLL